MRRRGEGRRGLKQEWNKVSKNKEGKNGILKVNRRREYKSKKKILQKKEKLIASE